LTDRSLYLKINGAVNNKRDDLLLGYRSEYKSSGAFDYSTVGLQGQGFGKCRQSSATTT
jgi:hypothetical protein